MAGKHEAPRAPLSSRARGAWGAAVVAVAAGLYSLIAGPPVPHSSSRPQSPNPSTTGSLPRVRTTPQDDLPPRSSVFVKASPSGSKPPVRTSPPRKAPVAPSPSPTRTKAPISAPKPIATVVGSAAQIVAFLHAQLGKAYVYGGNGPNSYDCSGLVVAAFKTVGIHLPRTSEQQATVGTAVSLHDLRPGDILFWGSPATHSAVYVGNGMFIGAENTHLGVVLEPLTWDYPSYARRVL